MESSIAVFLSRQPARERLPTENEWRLLMVVLLLNVQISVGWCVHCCVLCGCLRVVLACFWLCGM